jgi:endonuclease YncB( thermonuclease family)
VRPYAIHLLVFALGGAAGFLLAYGLYAPHEETGRVLNLSIVDGGLYRVRKVMDGNTVILENGLKVRYQGVDTPATGHFVKDAAPMAADATARNIQLVLDKRVRLRLAKDPFCYDHLMARLYVLPDEQSSGPELDVASVLIKEGLGKANYFMLTPQEVEALKVLEAQAKANKAGLWGLESKARPENAKPFCAATNSPIYHLSTCVNAQHIKEANRHEYGSREEAEAAGLRPCPLCLPK